MGSAPSVGLVVAHPDDETLWCGGTILSHPDWSWFVVTLCRGSDADRAARFRRALQRFGAAGRMSDLDDGPDQAPLPADLVENTILSLLPSERYDLLLTHGPSGEYTRHRRHEEAHRAVVSLWTTGRLLAADLWLFAYSDADGQDLPRAAPNAHHQDELPDAVWQAKYRIISEVYGFAPGSFEARTTPRVEAFWQFESPEAVLHWLGSRSQQA